MNDKKYELNSRDDEIELTEEERNIIRYCVEERYQQELMAMNSSKDKILRDDILKARVDILKRILDKLRKIREKEIKGNEC